MADDWVPHAQDRLLSLRRADTGWAEQQGSPPRVEPTVLACLGLLATDPAGGRALAASRSAAAWLGSFQNADGSLGLSQDLAAPCWATPHAIWLWAAMGDQPERLARAVGWLLGQKGASLQRSDDAPTGHDPTIVGWPWADETHSWLEPTAHAVLALRCAGQAGHPRAREGLRLIRDRAIPSGGWNYGNSSAFDRELRPQPATTGLALLALAGLEDRAAREDRALGYLREVLPTTRSPQALAWGLLALEAWGERPRDADSWLSEAYVQASAMRTRNHPTRLAYLLLARGGRSLRLLGVTLKEEARHES
jgi:hypothetical protein